MNLVIHDLKPEEWEAYAPHYAGCTVVSQDGPIRPCVGCFACWNRTPGLCVVKDGYEHMGELIHRAGEVTVISRYTYGGFSGFVKNVFDRCLGYVLPQFEVVSGETHHQKRYDEDKPFTFIFCGGPLTQAEKASAERYVRAVCANIRGHVKKVEFRESPGERPAPPARAEGPAGGTALLIGSMRGLRGNSGKLAAKLAESLTEKPELVTIQSYLKDLDALVTKLSAYDKLVLCVPLYVDGLPSQVIRLLERFEQSYRGASKKVFVLANMGLYESGQLCNLFEAVRQWCARMGFVYGGGLGVSAGELIGVLMEHIPFRFGTTKNIAKGMDRLAAAVNTGREMPVLYAEPFAFPRSLYIAIANTNWNKTARKNGLRPSDLYRKL